MFRIAAAKDEVLPLAGSMATRVVRPKPSVAP